MKNASECEQHLSPLIPFPLNTKFIAPSTPYYLSKMTAALLAMKASSAALNIFLPFRPILRLALETFFLASL